MKIAMVFPAFTGPYGGERLVLRLAAEFIEMGNEVTLFTPQFHPDCQWMVHPRLILIETGRRKWNHWDLDHIMEPYYAGRIYRYLNHEFDIINVHNYPTPLAGALAKVFKRLKVSIIYQCNEPPRAFYDLQDLTRERAGKPMSWVFSLGTVLYRLLDRWAIKKVDCIVTLSQFVAGEIRKVYGRESTVILPGIEWKRFEGAPDRETARKELGMAEEFIILTCNKLHPRKNVKILVDAFALISNELPGVKVVVVGDGIQRTYLTELVQEKKLQSRVIFTGFVAEARLPLYYASADLFVYTGIREPLGGSWAEAMAAGVPVLVPADGGGGECIREGENGWLYDPKDARDLASKIRWCLAYRDELGRTAAKGRDWVRTRRDWGQVAKQFQKVLLDWQGPQRIRH
jgi:glycosyltransferase involved in cell wall biosynthesis